MVERAPHAWRALQDNAALLRAHGLNIVCGDALEFLTQVPPSARFDVVFLDPPFEQGVPAGIWLRLPELLAEHGVIYLESKAEFAGRSQLHVLKRGHAGSVHYHLLGRIRDDQGGLSGNI
jgi:16S rRNA G966 N2-methylase RsmD